MPSGCKAFGRRDRALRPPPVRAPLGDTVNIRAAKWLGRRIHRPKHNDASRDQPLEPKARWPRAAYKIEGAMHVANVCVFGTRMTSRYELM